MDKLASFKFNEIELDCECEPDPQLCDLIPNFESMFTLLSLPNLDPILEPTLIPVSIYLKLNQLLWIVTFHLWIMILNLSSLI